MDATSFPTQLRTGHQLIEGCREREGASWVFGSLTGFHFALLESSPSQCPRLFLFLSLSLFFSSYFCSFLASCIYLSPFILAAEDKIIWFRSSKYELANKCHSNAFFPPNFWLDQLWRMNNTHSTEVVWMLNSISRNIFAPIKFILQVGEFVKWETYFLLVIFSGKTHNLPNMVRLGLKIPSYSFYI